MRTHDIDRCDGLITSFLDNKHLIVNVQESIDYFDSFQREYVVEAMQCVEADFISSNKNIEPEALLEIKSLFASLYIIWRINANASEGNVYSGSRKDIISMLFYKMHVLSNSNSGCCVSYPAFSEYIKLFSTGNEIIINESSGDDYYFPVEEKYSIESNQVQPSFDILKGHNLFAFGDKPIDVKKHFGPPLKPVFWEKFDYSTIFDDSGEVLTEDARNKGYEVVEVVTTEDLPKGNAFTVINHGTTNVQVSTKANENENSILAIIGEGLKNDDRYKNSLMINDGPGSVGDPGLLHPTVNQKTGNLVTVKFPSRYPQGRRLYEALSGFGLSNITNTTIRKLQWLELQGKLPERLNLLGFSRGGAENNYLANAVKKHFNHTIKIDVFSIDPVPGGTDIYRLDAVTLPDNIETYTSFLAENENRPHFQALDKRRLITEDSEKTKVATYGLPGVHDNLRMLNTDAGKWVAHSAVEFMKTKKIIDQDNPLYKRLSLAADDQRIILERLSQARDAPVNYVNRAPKHEQVQGVDKKLNPKLQSMARNISLYTPVGKHFLPDLPEKVYYIPKLDLGNRQEKSITSNPDFNSNNPPGNITKEPIMDGWDVIENPSSGEKVGAPNLQNKGGLTTRLKTSQIFLQDSRLLCGQTLSLLIKYSSSMPVPVSGAIGDRDLIAVNPQKPPSVALSHKSLIDSNMLLFL